MKILKLFIAIQLLFISAAYAVTVDPYPSFSGLTVSGQPIFKSCNGILIGKGTSNSTCTSGTGTTGQVLIGGTNPVWGAVNLSSMVTGILPPSGGGTGLNTFTRSGTTTKFATLSGSTTSGNIAKFDSVGNIIDGGSLLASLPTNINLQVDKLSIVTTNSIPTLTKPADGNFVQLVINGIAYYNVGTNPFFTITGNPLTNIIWNAVNAGFSVTSSDKVFAVYSTASGTGNGPSPVMDIKAESLTVLGTNSLSNITQTPMGSFFEIVLNNQVYTNTGASPAFTVSGTTINWNASNAGVSIGMSDKVSAVYSLGNIAYSVGQVGFQTDVLTVTGTNTVSDLTQNMIGDYIQLIVNSGIYTNAGASPAFTVAGSTITWNAVNAGFSLTVGDSVIAVYSAGNRAPIVAQIGLQTEKLTVTGTNTLSDITQPFNGEYIQIIASGSSYTNVGASPAFTISGSTITWSAVNSGVTLSPGDKVYVIYSSTSLNYPMLGAGLTAALVQPANAPNGLLVLDSSGKLSPSLSGTNFFFALNAAKLGGL